MISFDPFPTLETPRLVLRRLEPSDLAAMFRIQSDPVVTRYFGRPAHARIEQTEEFLFKISEGMRTATSIRWGITLRGNDELIGSMGFWRWNQLHFNAEIGYELAPSFWGRGIMVEAIRPILAYGFTTMQLHRVEANIDEENHASQRVLEKLGFTREALIRENWFDGKRFTSTGFYGLLKREFEANG